MPKNVDRRRRESIRSHIGIVRVIGDARIEGSDHPLDQKSQEKRCRSEWVWIHSELSEIDFHFSLEYFDCWPGHKNMVRRFVPTQGQVATG